MCRSIRGTCRCNWLAVESAADPVEDVGHRSVGDTDHYTRVGVVFEVGVGPVVDRYSFAAEPGGDLVGEFNGDHSVGFTLQGRTGPATARRPVVFASRKRPKCGSVR